MSQTVGMKDGDFWVTPNGQLLTIQDTDKGEQDLVEAFITPYISADAYGNELYLFVAAPAMAGTMMESQVGMTVERCYERFHTWQLQDPYLTADENIVEIFNVNVQQLEQSGDYLYCVAGDTRLSTQFGMVRLDQIPRLLHLGRQSKIKIDDERYNYETGLALKSEVYGRRTTVTNWIYSGVRPTLKIKTGLGYQLTVTANEKVRVLSPQLELGWKRADALTVGDQMVVQPGTDTLWPEQEPSLGKFTRWVPKRANQRNKHLAKVPQRMTPILARVLGYLVAEGHVADAYTRFVNSDPWVVADFYAALYGVFGDLEPGRYVETVERRRNRCVCNKAGAGYGLNKDSTCLSYNSTELAMFMEHLGYRRGAKSADKQVPQHIWLSTRAAVRAFLQALFEGDGCINENQVRYDTKSSQLAHEVQLLLLQFGIVGSCRRRSDNGMWCVLLGNRGYVQFNQKIGFRSPTKIGIWRKNRGRQRPDSNKNLLAVPGLRDAVLSECELRLVANSQVPETVKAGLTWSKHRVFLKLANGTIVASWLPRNMRNAKIFPAVSSNTEFMSSLCEVSPRLHQRLTAISEQGLVFSPLTAILRGKKQPVYDITVGKVHEFSANGLIISNSFDTHTASGSIVGNAEFPFSAHQAEPPGLAQLEQLAQQLWPSSWLTGG